MLGGGYSIFHLDDKIKLMAEFAAKENLKSSLRSGSRRGGRKGGVDIRVECITPDGLSGKKRVWFRVGIFHLFGILGESPFVSKLRKAESAQTKHAPDVCDSARSLAVFGVSAVSRQRSNVSSRPPAPVKGHNAHC